MRLIDADALIPMMKYATTDKEIGVFPIRLGFDAIKEIIEDAPTIEPSEYLKTIPTVYLLEALGVGSVEELMEEAEVMDEIEAYRSLIPDHKQNAEPSGDLISRMGKPISMEESLKDIEPWYEDDNLSKPMTSEELFKDLGIDDEAEPSGDLISRADAIEAFERGRVYHKSGIEEIINALPSADRPTDEWCVDCKEYDHEKKCCPRFNRVIRTTRDEFIENLVNTSTDRPIAQGFKGGKIPPKVNEFKIEVSDRPMGEWELSTNIPIRGGAYSAGYRCSVCGADYFQIDGMNFCPSCGAKMKGGKE